MLYFVSVSFLFSFFFFVLFLFCFGRREQVFLALGTLLDQLDM